MTRLSSHSVPATAAGFIYQLERGLYHLAKSQRATTVGIETLDDVVVLNDGNPSLFEQDKLSLQASGHPLTDKSKNLWNTLNIWLEATSALPPNREVVLSLVTTRPVPACIARRMSDAKKQAEVSACVTELRSLGTSDQEDVQGLMTKVLGYRDDRLSYVIKHLELTDANGPVRVNDVNILDLLQIPSDIDASFVLQALQGWLQATVMNLWFNGQCAWISREAFINQMHHIVFKIRKGAFRERYEHLILVTDTEKDDARTLNFYEHLMRVNVNVETSSSAVESFIRFRSEYSRLMREGEISPDDWKGFFTDLSRRWKTIKRNLLHVRRNAGEEEIIGQQLLRQTTESNYKAPLAGNQTTEDYLTCGGYHHLANNDEVWWHPMFGIQQPSTGGGPA